MFSIYFVQQMNIWLCKNCIKTQERENRRDLYTLALSLFNYHIKVKYKCLYQFLINVTLSISIRQISEVLKQRHNSTCKKKVWNPPLKWISYNNLTLPPEILTNKSLNFHRQLRFSLFPCLDANNTHFQYKFHLDFLSWLALYIN